MARAPRLAPGDTGACLHASGRNFSRLLKLVSKIKYKELEKSSLRREPRRFAPKSCSLTLPYDPPLLARLRRFLRKC